MNKKNNQKPIFLLGLSVLFTSTLVLGWGSHNLDLITASGNEPVSYTLDSNDAASELTDSFQEEVIDRRDDSSTLTYLKAKAYADGLVTLADGGSLTKDAAYGLDTFVCDFDGELELHIGLEEDNFTDHYRLVSGQTITGIEANYFRLIATKETNITSINATYGCTVDKADTESHEHVFSSTKLGTHAQQYACTTCGMLRYHTLTNSSTNVDILGTGSFNLKHGENAFTYNDGTDSRFIYSFYSDANQSANIELGICFAHDGVYGSMALNSVIKVWLNDVEISLDTPVNSLVAQKTSWTTYASISFGEHQLNEGINYVRISSVSANTNVGFVNFSNHKYGIQETFDYIEEGEHMVHSATDTRKFFPQVKGDGTNNFDWRPSGDGYICNAQYSNNKFTFYAESPSDQIVDFTINMGRRSDYEYKFGQYHEVLVNGVKQDGITNSNTLITKTLAGKNSWTDFEEFLIGPIALKKGINTIMFHYTGTDQNHSSNIDYVKLTSKDTLKVYGDERFTYNTYRFEAEDFLTAGGSVVNTVSESTELHKAGNPSGAGFVGAIASVGQTATWTVNFDISNIKDYTFSDKNSNSTYPNNIYSNTRAYLSIGFGRRNSHTATNFAATNNGKAMTFHDDGYIGLNYTDHEKTSTLEWASWKKFVVGTFDIEEGANELIINKLADSEGSNVDYFEITTTADISAKYMVQAENVSLTGSASTSKVDTAIGKYHVGGIAQRQSGSMTFQVYSHKNQTVEFGINFGEYQQFLFDNAFDLKVNDEFISSDATILAASTSAWTEWTEYDIANIELEAGWNTIVVDKNNHDAIATNIDYFYFNNVSDLVYFSY